MKIIFKSFKIFLDKFNPTQWNITISCLREKTLIGCSAQQISVERETEEERRSLSSVTPCFPPPPLLQ